MRVFVTGATGLVGRALCDELLRRGDEVVALSRKSQRSVHGSLRWVVGDPGASGPWTNEVEGTCAVAVRMSTPGWKKTCTTPRPGSDCDSMCSMSLTVEVSERS